MSIVQAKIEELRENPGTPFRQPAVAVLTIDSRDRVKIDDATGYRIDNSTPYQILINKQQSVMNGFFTRIGLTEVNMQWDIPNVIGSGPQKNNTLLLERGAAAGVSTVTASRTITIEQGFYTPYELAQAVQVALNAAGGTFGITTWICSYIQSVNDFIINTFDPTVVFRIRPQNIGFNDDLCNMMGFSFPSSQFAAGVRGSFASMQYTPYFDIVSDNLTKKQNVRDNGTSFLTGQNLLARVYLSEPGVNKQSASATAAELEPNPSTIVGVRPFTLYREYQTPKQIYWDTQEFINVIDLRLIDYKGRTLFAQEQRGVIVDDAVTICGDSSQFQLTIQVTET